ncbi:RNA-binding protein [Aquisalimonas sp. 2447]|uniref:RNA recognition motif domain-containing protein n=1 Tax=Aquisalimonas sp. 2447 TaxID=2740807 RepID=UPI0014328059|nr:RNA-binding protein [Aquisalimonas sp. 2447]QIT55108.1 RNA-binding protein [Aquisalimonas sp. 2447]
MHRTIYVGNLPFSCTDDDVRALFGDHGEVYSVKLITDRDSGRPRGFGFVEMDADAASAAIAALNGLELQGRSLRINLARQRTGHRVRRPF